MINNRFPCGQCIECRVNKQAEKALRIMHELQYHKDNVFVTLTYAPEFLPEGETLVKEDAQKFMKRVRKYLGDDRVRYFLSGEYGDAGNRPHYHLIIFGLGMRDKRLFFDFHYDPQEGVWRCKCKAWNKGFVTVSPVTEYRVNYVAKYLLKKITGEMAKEYYGSRLPEFQLCSRNPGIGYQYMLDHAYRLKEDDCCTVRGKKRPLPRYYIDKLYDVLEKVKRSEEREARKHERIEEDRVNFDKLGAYGYAQLQRDRIAQNAVNVGLRLQRKRGTKCPVK